MSEAEADVSRGALMSQPPSALAAYPPGTVVVVHSLDVDPGRTLKFARDETYEAMFKELVGREVSAEEAVMYRENGGFRVHV